MAAVSHCPPEWLDLRESADAAARAPELLDPLLPHLQHGAGETAPLVVRDLGCGTGSMGRWLAGRLPGPQHWVLHDRDPALLARASVTGPAADGGAVTVETRESDITGLGAHDLADTMLLTASAVLDLLTPGEVDRIAAACAGAGCPALFPLTVVGRVALSPADPLDMEIAAAFNAHQRRTTGGRRLLGPDAAAEATAAFERHGARVWGRPSPWRLGAGQAALAAEWLRGWVAAAVAHRPELAQRSEAYLSRRREECAAGALDVVVWHRDLLALPSPLGGAQP